MASSPPGIRPTWAEKCGSSQQAVHFAAQAVMSGTQDVVIAAGVESMSRVPMGSPVTLAEKAGVGTGPWSERIRRRYGVRQFSQFTGAQMLAEKYGFTREQLDEYALRSHQRAAAAIRSDAFNEEIVPLEIADGTLHTVDEGVRFDASIEAISSVKPLQEGSVLSAANSSQICDGASAVLVVNERGLKTHNLKPLARIHNLTVVAGDPVPSSWQRSSTRCASAASATHYRRCARAAASPTRPSSKRFERSGFGILRAEHRAALLPHGIDRFAMIGGARHRRLVGHACIHHGEHGALQVDIHQ